MTNSYVYNSSQLLADLSINPKLFKEEKTANQLFDEIETKLLAFYFSDMASEVVKPGNHLPAISGTKSYARWR